MFGNLSFALCFINIVLFVYCESSIYTVIGPATIRSFSKYNVAVTLYEAKEPCIMEIGISGIEYNQTKTIDIQPLSTENVEFDLPELKYDNYKLTIKGVAGIEIENSTDLQYAEYKPLILMQTDKAIYKPGDLVRFRVLFLDEYTHPVMLDQPKMIVIKDNNGDRIKIWKNIELTQGVYTGNFQLSEQTVLGIWQIEAYFDDTVSETKTFQVAKYELPKFQVTIEAVKNVAVTDEVIRVTVRAKYTFGKPIKGKATISIGKSDQTEQFGIKKTIAINGKAQVEFNIKEEVLSANLDDGWKSENYKIFADVDEELTENMQSDVIDIIIHEKNIILEAVQQPYSFDVAEPITLTVAVKRVFDGSPVQDTQNPINLLVNNMTYVSQLNENGLATFKFSYPLSENLNVSCIYRDVFEQFADIYVMSKNDDNPLELILNRKKQQLGKDVFIELKWKEPINCFTYAVTARGNIVQAATVAVTSHNMSNSYILKFNATYEMIPRATIIVQYIHDNNLRFTEESIEFEKDFQNTLQILTTTRQASPGDDIEFHISTDPNSFIGLLGIDQSVLLLQTGNDLERNVIFDGLEKYTSKAPQIASYSINPYPGKLSGLVTLTNAYYPFSDILKIRKLAFHRPLYSSPSRQREVFKLRKNFEESWIFEDLQITNQTSINFTKKIPDTLTSWVITGFSLNAKTGIALTENPTVIEVFKPFFISIYLPYAVRQGEIIAIPVLIFNYMNVTLDTEIIMNNSEQEYEFIEAINDAEEHAIVGTIRSKCISVVGNSVGSVSFMIRPKIIGFITIKVNAITAVAGDGVQKSLKVEPEGVTHYENRAFFINLNDKQEEHSEIITIDIPDNAVPHSEHIEFSAIGDLVGLTIMNIENLVRLPIGTSEQNLINFVPSILVLEYLETLKQIYPNITEKAHRILKRGFQRELKYKLSDGSFGTTENDITGSTWLTAYIVRSFQQASKFIYIDPDLITRALDFLASKQTTSGDFAEFGQLVNASYSSHVSFSAFVLLAFLEHKDNDNSSKYRGNVESGVRFLLQHYDNTDDIQSLSIIALVLQELKHPLADEVLTKLIAVAKNENGYTWWSIETTKKNKRKIPNSSDIEVTSYILQALLEKDENSPMVLPIIKWLIMQQNSNGGFITTRDTVVGLQALIKFAKKTGLTQTGTVQIDYVCDDGVDNGTITISPDNFMLLNMHKLPENTRKIKFTAKGNTSALLQLSYQYNTVSRKPLSSFSLNLNIRKDQPPKKLALDICATYVPTDVDIEGNATNLVVLEVTLPTGYTTNREELDGLRDFKTILFTETLKLDTIAIVYFQSLAANDKKCISFNATRTYDIAKQKPVPISIYDYYDKERGATEYYEITTPLCDICESDECGAFCKENKGLSASSTSLCTAKA